jgi:hypothetical protein
MVTLNTFTSGINTDFSTELNENFNEINDNFYVHFKTDELAGAETTNSTSYETLKTTDVEDDNIYSFTYDITMRSQSGSTGSAQFLITYADDTTTTQAIGSVISDKEVRRKGSFVGSKLIKTIAWQALTSNATYYTSLEGYGDEDFTDSTTSAVTWITFPDRTS